MSEWNTDIAAAPNNTPVEWGGWETDYKGGLIWRTNIGPLWTTRKALWTTKREKGWRVDEASAWRPLPPPPVSP